MSANRLRRISFLFAVFLSACSSHIAPSATLAQSDTPDVFPAIPEVRAVDGVATVKLEALVDPVSGQPEFSYRETIGVAPTIRVSPGDTIDLTLGNGFPAGQKDLRGVNVHFHGLEVSPNAPGDDSIMTIASAGQTLHYVLKIPPEQEPGLYWYHPHSHGEAYREVTGGMSGAIVVEGLEKHVPALAAMKERVIVLRDIATRPGYVDDDAARQPQTNGAAAQPRATTKGGPCRAESGLLPSLNRLPHANIGIEPGEREFFRVVNASAARHFDLSIDGERLELVALDGVALDGYPGSRAIESVAHIVLPPAGRAEFIVTGLAHSTTLRSACFNSGSAGDANPAVVLATLVDPHTIFGTPAPAAIVNPGAALAAQLVRDDVIASLPQAHHAPTWPKPAAQRTVTFTEDSNGFYIDGKTFDMNAPPSIVARSGTTEEWTIVNKTDEVHDFHIHQIHFAAERIDGKAVRERHWQDTVVVHPRGSVRLLMDFRDPIVRGTFLYHCHILDHEDQGMMAKIRVI